MTSDRFIRWRKAGVWDKFLRAVSETNDGKIQMIDNTFARVHQHVDNGEKNAPVIIAWAAPAAGLRPRSTRSSMRTDSRSR